MDANRLTQKSQEALSEAQTKAVRFGHVEIDVEHLLAALLEQEEGLIPRLFTKMDVPLEPFKAEVEKELGKRARVSGPGAEAGKVYITQRLNKLLVKAEDEAKLSLYEQLLAETSQPERRAEALWALIRWLTIKHQVAMGGFGISLVPEWEEQVNEIQSGLSTRYEDLYFAYEDMVTALPDASHLDQASYVVRREMNLAGRLGQYPNFPTQQMADKLQDAAFKLVAAESQERLFVDVLVKDGQSRFFLSTADVYGQSPQSP